MRTVVLWLLVAVTAADLIDEPYEEEDVNDYPEEAEDVYYRRKRDADPYAEHIRVKRCCSDRVRRSAEYVRPPRQIPQYQVHEFTDEHDPSSPPYEEMLSASANHYHSVHAPKTPRYLNPEASPTNVVSHQPLHQHVHNQPHSQPLQHQPANQPLEQPTFKPVQFVPIASPAYVSQPVEVPPEAGVPLMQLGDLSAAAGRHLLKHSHGHKQGGGHGNHAQHHNLHGGKTSKGFSKDHHVDRGVKGHKTDDLHKKEYEEAVGKKKKHHDQAGHKGKHEEEAHGHRGAHFDEKKGHKKGHKTKGYHNKYHKDEFHKEHKFYDDYHKSGEHHRYGKFNAKHAANESGNKKAHHVNAGHDYVEKGKKGYSNKGHVDADHKGHNGKHGHEEHRQHSSSHGKKGGKEGGSHWGYAKKN